MRRRRVPLIRLFALIAAALVYSAWQAGSVPVLPKPDLPSFLKQRPANASLSTQQSSAAPRPAVSTVAGERFVPPLCAHSGVSQFDAVGQHGVIATNAVQRRDRPDARSGTAIASGVTFTVIGVSQCAVPETYRAETLFLRVRLDNVTGDVGWINESGLTGSGGIAYNVHPID